MEQVMNILDAASGVFFKRELEHIKTKSYDVEYAELTYDKVFAISSVADASDEFITYYTYDEVGMAKIINNYAKDLPRVDVSGVPYTSPVKSLGDAFGYTILEIMASKKTGKKLDQRRSNAARKAIEQLLNSLAYFGDAASKLVGLFTHPNIPRVNSVGGAWSGLTAAQIRDNINLGFRTIRTTTNSVEKATKVILTPTNWSIVMEKDMSDTYPGQTIAAWFVANSPHIKSLDDFVEAPEMVDADSGGDDASVFLNPDPERVEFEIPQDVFYHEVEKRGLEYITDVTARCGGLTVYKPLSILIMEGC